MKHSNGAHFRKGQMGASSQLNVDSSDAGHERLRVANLFIIALLGAVMMSFGTCWVIERLNSPIAQDLQLDKNRSYLEGKEYARFPEASYAAFVSSDLQSGVESFVSDRMPLRDNLLLLNAAWQRGLIWISACAHDFAVYPTFYGSSYAYDSDNDALYAILEDATQGSIEQYESAAEAYSDFAARHTEQNFYFYRVDRLSSSSNNPTNELQNESINSEFLSNHFFNRLANIEIIDGLLDGQDESLEVFFRSDHHWNGIGAYRAYVDILASMRPEYSPVTPNEEVHYLKPEFQGSCARASLCPVNHGDLIHDYVIDMSDYQVFIDGVETSAQSLQHTDRYEKGEWSNDPFTNRYSEYWHTDYALIEVNNLSSNSGNSLLIVRDSFSAPLERYFADNYSTVYALDPRHSETSIEEFLYEHDVDDVLFLMGSTTFPTDQAVNQLSD